jgi:hypothetical protein
MLLFSPYILWVVIKYGCLNLVFLHIFLPTGAYMIVG